LGAKAWNLHGKTTGVEATRTTSPPLPSLPPARQAVASALVFFKQAPAWLSTKNNNRISKTFRLFYPFLHANKQTSRLSIVLPAPLGSSLTPPSSTPQHNNETLLRPLGTGGSSATDHFGHVSAATAQERGCQGKCATREGR